MWISIKLLFLYFVSVFNGLGWVVGYKLEILFFCNFMKLLLYEIWFDVNVIRVLFDDKFVWIDWLFVRIKVW